MIVRKPMPRPSQAVERNAIAPLVFASVLLSSSAPVSAQDGPIRAPSKTLTREISAVGALQVRAFSNPFHDLSCTATHLGRGIVLSAGHCFLGALACNGATVLWQERNAFGFQKSSRCRRVLFNFADDARGAGRNQDFVLFEVDTPPDAAVEVNTTERTTPSQHISIISLPRPERGLARDAFVSKPCQAFGASQINPFLRPRHGSTFIHGCETPPNSNGAPIFDLETRKLVGLHQASYVLPQDNGDAVSYFSPAKHIAGTKLGEILASLESGAGLFAEPPENIVIGGFASEAYPTGFPHRIRLQVVTLDARHGHETVSFLTRFGPGTEVHIVDASGAKIVKKGVPSLEESARLQFRAPVRIEVRSRSKNHVLSAEIQAIESP